MLERGRKVWSEGNCAAYADDGKVLDRRNRGNNSALFGECERTANLRRMVPRKQQPLLSVKQGRGAVSGNDEFVREDFK